MRDFKNLGLSDGTIARLEHEGIKSVRELMQLTDYRMEGKIGTSCMIELATALPDSFEIWREENPRLIHNREPGKAYKPLRSRCPCCQTPCAWAGNQVGDLPECLDCGHKYTIDECEAYEPQRN